MSERDPKATEVVENGTKTCEKSCLRRNVCPPAAATHLAGIAVVVNFSLSSVMKYRAFLTHNWGTMQDDGSFNVHERVLRIAEALQAQGYPVWIDAERMTGAIVKQMCDGIDDSEVVIVFITAEYIRKVGGNNAGDNCLLEFNYAMRRKTKAKMLAVVLETHCRNANNWTGPVGICLGGELYVDFCSDDGFDAKIAQICAEIDNRTDNWMVAAVGDVIAGLGLAAEVEASTAFENPHALRYAVKTVAEIKESKALRLPWGIMKPPVGKRIYDAARKGDMASLLPLVDKWFAHDVLNWANPADNGRTPLHTDKAAAVQLLAAAPGIDVNKADRDGNTACMKAASEGNVSIVKALLAAPGIDHGRINKDGWTTVMIAAFKGHTEVVRALLAAPGIDLARKVAFHDKARLVGKTALEIALISNKLETAALFRSASKAEEEEAAAAAAAEREMRRKDAGKCIYDAAEAGVVAALRPLLQEWSGHADVLNWANPGYFDWHPLLIASELGNAEAVKLLLSTPGETVAVVHFVSMDSPLPHSLGLVPFVPPLCPLCTLFFLCSLSLSLSLSQASTPTRRTTSAGRPSCWLQPRATRTSCGLSWHRPRPRRSRPSWRWRWRRRWT